MKVRMIMSSEMTPASFNQLRLQLRASCRAHITHCCAHFLLCASSFKRAEPTCAPKGSSLTGALLRTGLTAGRGRAGAANAGTGTASSLKGVGTIARLLLGRGSPAASSETWKRLFCNLLCCPPLPYSTKTAQLKYQQKANRLTGFVRCCCAACLPSLSSACPCSACIC